jgi:hypothetical protein
MLDDADKPNQNLRSSIHNPMENMFKAPSGATNFKIETSGAEIDFENETFVMDAKESTVLPLGNTATAAITLSNAVTANSTHPLFLVIGVEFYREVNVQMYPLKNRVFNTLTMVNVSEM